MLKAMCQTCTWLNTEVASCQYAPSATPETQWTAVPVQVDWVAPGK